MPSCFAGDVGVLNLSPRSYMPSCCAGDAGVLNSNVIVSDNRVETCQLSLY
jgi:hypothetical protein